jgi:hypothetical protein
MTIRIIVLFEVINIEHDQAENGVVGGCLLRLLREFLQEVAMVVDVG